MAPELSNWRCHGIETNFEVARCCHPRLTTIAVDCAGIGPRAAEVALAALEARNRDEKRAHETRRIEFHIVACETA